MDGTDRPPTGQRDKLIAEHLHFPRVIALEVIGGLNRGTHLDDLIASGNIGLVEAAERFKPDCGLKFSTFAWYRIRGAMVDGLRIGGRYSRSAVARFRREAANDTGGGIPVAVTPKADRGEETFPHLEEELDRRRHMPRLAQALAQLPDRERDVTKLHYFEGLQLTDVAGRMGLSRSYVTRLHQRALQLLQDDVALPDATGVREAA